MNDEKEISLLSFALRVSNREFDELMSASYGYYGSHYRGRHSDLVPRSMNAEIITPIESQYVGEKAGLEGMVIEANSKIDALTREIAKLAKDNLGVLRIHKEGEKLGLINMRVALEKRLYVVEERIQGFVDARERVRVRENLDWADAACDGRKTIRNPFEDNLNRPRLGQLGPNASSCDG